MKSKSLLFPVAIVLAWAPSAFSANVDSKANGDWTTVGTWSTDAAPSAGNDYFIKSGFTVDSPITGSTTSPGPVSTFGGDSITVENGGILRLRHNNGGGNAFVQYNLKTLTLQNGATLQSYSTSNGNVIRRLNSPIVVAATGSTTIRIQSDSSAAWTNHLYLNGALSGGADINVTAGLAAGATGDRRVLRVSSADNTYSGNWIVTGDGGDDSRRLYLDADAANALGTGTVTLNLRSQLRVTANGTIGNISSVTLNQSTSTLQFQNAGGWTNASASLIANNGTIDLGAAASSIGSFRLDSAGTVTLNAAGGSLAATNFDIRRGTLSGSGSITGSGALAKTTAGTAIISTSNSGFSGTATVSDGILRLNNAAALGSATGIVVENAKNPGSFNSTVLELAGGHTYGTGATVTLRNNSTSNIGNARAHFTNQAGDNTWAGNIIFDGGPNQALTTSAGSLTITGNISQSATPSSSIFLRGTGGTGIINGNVNLGSANLTKTDVGTWEINTAGNTWANTGVSIGILRLGATNALPVTTNLTIGQLDGQNATLDLNGNNQTVAGLSFVSTGGTKQITSSTAATFTVNNAANNTYAGQINGEISLIKQNTGTLTLSGTSTFTGSTTVSAGTLLINGILGDTAVSIATDAILGGSGTIGGSLHFAEDSFLTITNLSSPLIVADGVTFASGFGIDNLVGINWASLDLNTTYTLLASSTDFSTVGLDHFGIENAYPVGGGRSAFFQNGSLQVVVIPEPRAALLGALGLGLLMRRRRC